MIEEEAAQNTRPEIINCQIFDSTINPSMYPAYLNAFSTGDNLNRH